MRTMIVAAAALAVLVACGGGSMSGSNVNPVQGVSQIVSTSGTITAFGSVFVNGVRYDVSAAKLKKNGRVVAQAALAVGEVALVRGKQNLSAGQGSAESVEVEDNVVGPVGTITGTSELTVLGQTVKVTAGTSFGKGITPADLTGLKAGDPVEVSGLADATGAIAESPIALRVLNRDGALTFTLGALPEPIHDHSAYARDYAAARAALAAYREASK